MSKDDGWNWVREEQKHARDTQSHREHPLDCTCGCRYTKGDEK